MSENKYENFLNRQVDDRAESDLQKQLENILPAVRGQFEDYYAHGHEKLWQMKNEGIISVVNEAKKMLSEHGSSQLIQKAMEDGKLEGQFDNARVLAFARLIEVSNKEMN